MPSSATMATMIASAEMPVRIRMREGAFVLLGGAAANLVDAAGDHQ